MRLLPVGAALCLFLSPLPSFASESKNFNSVYKAYTQAQEAGDVERTVELAEQAVELGEIRFANDAESLTNLKYNLALALTDDAQLEAAEKVYKEIRQAYKKQFGEISQPYFLASLDLLGLYSESGWSSKQFKLIPKRSSTLVNRVIYIAKKLEKENTPESATNYYLAMKAIYGNPGIQGNYKPVLQLAETARDKMLANFGESDQKTIEARYFAGRLNMTPGRYENAVENLETIVSTIKTSLETSHPYELASHAALIETYEKLGKSEEATKHCVAIGQLTPWKEDIEPTPLYRINPKYPESYLKNRRQGHTQMTFDISASGFVENIQVIDSSSPLFTKESIAALNKWRYAPKFENGQAVTATDIKVQLDYKIQGN